MMPAIALRVLVALLPPSSPASEPSLSANIDPHVCCLSSAAEPSSFERKHDMGVFVNSDQRAAGSDSAAGDEALHRQVLAHERV